LSGYLFDTDILSAVMRRDPPLALVRRLAQIAPERQFTSAITLGELLYGAARRGSDEVVRRVRELVVFAQAILSFDESAAEIYGPLRARLEREGRRLDEPDLRIASIALAHDLTLVSGNVAHFARVQELPLENWLQQP
jgi:predicted nucleic acid-binding protein